LTASRFATLAADGGHHLARLLQLERRH
jgi:hypothetical protein